MHKATLVIHHNANRHEFHVCAKRECKGAGKKYEAYSAYHASVQGWKTTTNPHYKDPEDPQPAWLCPDCVRLIMDNLNRS